MWSRKRQSRSEARTIWMTKDVSPCETDAWKGPTGKTRTPSNDTSTMVRRRRKQKITVIRRVERTPHNVVRQNPLEKHVYVATRTERNQNSKHCVLTLNAEAPQQPLNQRPDFALAKKNANDCMTRAVGKDPRRIQSYASQTTNKTVKKDNNWRTTKNMTSRLVRKQVGGPRRVAGKFADNFVRIVGQPANSFVIVVNVGPDPLEDEQLEFSWFFKPWRLVTFSQG